VVARALFVVSAAGYDAWSAYDAKAVPTIPTGFTRRPSSQRTLANKTAAVSYASHRALAYLTQNNPFQPCRADLDERLTALGLSVAEATSASPASTPGKDGKRAADNLIAARRADGSNQAGNYADTTGYRPVNTGEVIVDPWRWQPLRVPLGVGPQQVATTPQWSRVKGFALKSPFQFAVPGPDRLGSGFDPRHIDNLLALTSNLNDRQKVTAEYWADGPRSEFPPGHWALLAQVLSRKRGHSLDTDAKLFFALGNALLDASIAAWAAKYRWDFVRPITAIRSRYQNKPVTSWLGPYQGYGTVPGERWVPYQAPNVVTPPFPEYVSGHSTFSSAAAAILAKFTGSDSFGAGVTIEAGTSLFEPKTDAHPTGYTPAANVTLSWPTMTAAAKDAGLSRRLGGIHFQDGDEHGYNLGQRVGTNVLAQTMGYINGTIAG
jgi:hypothetical protein